jgi:hypothetical protein
VLPNCKEINSSRGRGELGDVWLVMELPRRVNSELRFEGDWRGRLAFIPIGK